tara:strand:- start:65 stop:328 length:264 start_codon:yes stop_codon:yes gene_type:complete
LVELDVKKQKSNVALNNSNASNNAIAKQLEIQNKQLKQKQYDKGTKFLFDLSQELIKPKQYNSNIYMPQTQRCTIHDFGTFSKMICN